MSTPGGPASPAPAGGAPPGEETHLPSPGFAGFSEFDAHPGKKRTPDPPTIGTPDDGSFRIGREVESAPREPAAPKPAPAAEGKPKVEAAPAGDTPPETPAPEAPPKPKHRFADREYDSPEAAEHHFKTELGRLRAATERAKVLEAAVRERDEYIASLRNGQPSTPGTRDGRQSAVGAAEERGDEPATPWYDQVDPQTRQSAVWNRYKELHLEKGPEYAGYFLARKVHENLVDHFERVLDARLGPMEKLTQVQTIFGEVSGRFESMAALRDQSGGYVYPELRLDGEDPRLMDLVQTWRTVDPDNTMGERGIRLAVLDWRDRNGGRLQPKATPAPNGAPGSTPAGSGAASLAATALAQEQQTPPELLGGNGSPREAPSGRMTREQAIKQELREGDKRVKSLDGELLFSR